MPREPRAPDPLPEIRRSRNDAERLDAFQNDILGALWLAQEDQDLGVNEAAVAAFRLVRDLTDDPNVRALFAALVARTYPRSPKSDPLPLARTKSFIIATADFLHWLDFDIETSCKSVAKIVEEFGIKVGKPKTRIDREKELWETISDMRRDYLRRKADRYVISWFDARRGLHRKILGDLPISRDDKKELVLAWLGDFLRENRADWEGVIAE